MFTAISAHGFQCKTPCQRATDDDIHDESLGIDHVSRRHPHFCEVYSETNSFLGVGFETLCPDPAIPNCKRKIRDVIIFFYHVIKLFFSL